MSFYGSVYYQLIDTFYKIIVKNSGDKTFDFNPNIFNNSDTPADQIVESPAVGRKGVFSLDSGNYWINFSKTDADESAPYKIWHSPANPEPSRKLQAGGLIVETDKYFVQKNEAGDEISVVDENGEEMIAGEHYIQLNDSEFIRTHNAEYDEAGHIIEGKTQSVLYRLPKANINERMDKLEVLLGTPTENLEMPRPDITQAEIEDLISKGKEYEGEDYIYSITDYAEKNFEDIKTLEKYVGDWSKSNDMYSIGYAPSMSEWIGDIDKLYEDGDGFYFHEGDTLTRILGVVPRVWREYTGQASGFMSISDALVEAKKKIDATDTRLDTAVTALQNTDNAIYDIIGEYGGRQKIFAEIDATNTKLAEVEAAYKEQDAALEKKIDDNDTAIRADASVWIATAKNEIRTEFEAADDALEADYTTKLNNVTTDYRDADAAIRQNISDHINQVNTSIEGINQSIADTNTRITELNTAHQQDKTAIWNSIGTGDNPGSTTVIGRLNEHDTTLSSNATTLEDHSTRIGNLESALGTSTGEGTIAEQITNNAIAIGDIQTDLSSYKTTVAGQISGLEESILKVKGTADTNTSSIASINQSVSEINGEITNLKKIDHSVYETSTHAAETFATIDSLNTAQEGLDAVEEALTTVVGLEEAEGLQGQTVINLLLQLSNQIDGIKSDILLIKQEINEQHPGAAEDFSDYPFPDVMSNSSNS